MDQGLAICWDLRAICGMNLIGTNFWVGDANRNWNAERKAKAKAGSDLRLF
jgi:hypothetical protein